MGLLLSACSLASGTPAQACQQFPMIYFGYGSATPNEEGLAQLRQFARQALTNLQAIERIRTIGHSDRTGARWARQRIALRRAEAVREILIAYGVPAALISASGVADRQPWTETDDNVREPLNRRATLSVSFTPQRADPRARPTSDRSEAVPLC